MSKEQGTATQNSHLTTEALAAVTATGASMFDRIPGGFARMTAQTIRGIGANATDTTRDDAFTSINEIVRSMYGNRDRTEYDAVLRAHELEVA